MIPVKAAPEPPTFQAKVRTPGLAWLAAKGLSGVGAAPKGLRVKPYWTESLDDMLKAYNRLCAYACLRIPHVTGARSVDHFAPKSKALTAAYEWNNYRLACSLANARKNNFTGLLDPFTMRRGTFELDVITGGISVAKQMTGAYADRARLTCRKLKLDGPEMRAARLHLIDRHLGGHLSDVMLKEESPFIWAELERQGMLRVGPVPLAPLVPI